MEQGGFSPPGVSSEALAQCERYRRAVERQPGSAPLRNDLAVLLCNAGDYGGALEQIQKAIELRPDLAATYVNGAVIAGRLHGCEASLPWVDAALEVDPNFLPAILLRADTLAKLSRPQEAVALASRAVAAHPADGTSAEVLAGTLQAAGRYDEALAAFARAEALGANSSATIRKASLLTACGRAAEATAALEALLARQPDLAAALYAHAFAKNFALDEGEIARLERALEAGKNLSFEDRVQLEFALGGARLATGDVAAAFAHLNRGNALKRSSIRYDVAADEAHMQQMSRRYSASFLARMGERGDPSEVPVFVVGMPRSGTSLIEQILASHPLAFGAGELNYVWTIAEEIRATSPKSPADFGRQYAQAVSALTPDALRIVDKMPLNFVHAGLIRLILPRARIIHCRRDPRDTCLSLYATLFDQHVEFSYNLAELGRYYRAYERLMDHWRAVLPPESFLEIDYENVVADLEREVRRMLDFCGLPWAEECLAFHATQRAVQTASASQVRRPVYRSSVGRWKECEPYLGELLAQLQR